MDNVTKFLDSKLNAWSDETLRSAKHKLKIFSYEVENKNPDKAWVKIEHLSPYSRVSYWHIACAYYDFIYPEEKNIFKQWRALNAKVFRHTYTKRQPEISYQEAEQALATIQNTKVRAEAFKLLKTGLRISERYQITPDGFVKGKGGKVRKVYSLDVLPDKAVTSSDIRKALKPLGLKPHDLRKIRATYLARCGMKESDLCKVFGWESFATASSYIAPMNDDKIEALMKD